MNAYEIAECHRALKNLGQPDWILQSLDDCHEYRRTDLPGGHIILDRNGQEIAMFHHLGNTPRRTWMAARFTTQRGNAVFLPDHYETPAQALTAVLTEQ